MNDNQGKSESGSWLKFALMVAVAAYLIYDMATATEAPSLALRVLQYVILGALLLGLGGLLTKLLSAKRS